MALTDKLTAIADATRAKTGTTNQMTLDEIATAINGISSKKKIIILSYPTYNAQYPTYAIQHSSYSENIDTNFTFYLVFGCNITGTSGMVGKILKVDRNKSIIQEVDTIGSFESSTSLNYSINENRIEISTGSSNKTMTFSGYVNLFGVQK